MNHYVIGVDVGTGSARAGLFDAQGQRHGSAVEPIRMWHPRPDHAEQSSDDIWRAVAKVVKACRKEAGVKAEAVAGISFDATCSLVVLDGAGRPLAVNDEGHSARNVIVWMDHRALAEAEEINAGEHEVLRYVGGRISPEMEIPKLLWLKRHLAATWKKAGRFFDLADFLTWRASGSDARSLCTVVCKWTYLGHAKGKGGTKGRWDRAFLKKIGLADLLQGDRLTDDVRSMGAPLGGLTRAAAKELGLTTSCLVGAGIIDAHAGGLGLLGQLWHGQEGTPAASLEHGLALIGGTSSCHMAVSAEPRFIEGIWGPYYGAMVPGLWLTEGGQTSAGSAIDHVIASHPNALRLQAEAAKAGQTVYQRLNLELSRLQQGGRGPEIVKDLHVVPEFLGNRSPRANPSARGAIEGLSLDETITSQALAYYACIQGVAYGTREIVAAMNASGYAITRLLVTGGGTKNPVWLQEHADATGCSIVLAREEEAVLLGAAMLGATAAGLHAGLPAAMKAMSAVGRTVAPRQKTAAYHRAKYREFLALVRGQEQRRARMASLRVTLTSPGMTGRTPAR